MRIDFDERFAIPLPEVERYFRTPADWVRLYGLAGSVGAPERGRERRRRRGRGVGRDGSGDGVAA